MTLQPDTFKSLVKVAAEQVIASAGELTALDQAIGDGDHGTNMKRGFEAVLGKLDTISTQPLDEALKTIGKTLPEDLADVFGSGVNAVSARGRSHVGEKTMLDVLVPVLETLKADVGRADLIERVRTTASEAVERTVPMQATKGRASFLGARSIGHVDPGARSSCVLVHAVCSTLEARP